MSNDYSNMNTHRHDNLNITTGSAHPIKEWTVGVDVEEGARKQLFNTAQLPFIFKHIAVMPDVHFGIGSTVGSVIPTQKAIIPAAVGVDIGCVDAETEFLTPQGWKRIADYEDGDPVLIWDRERDSAFFAESKYVKLKCNEFWHIKTKYGVNQMLSDEHNVLYFKYSRDYKFEESETISAEELANKHNSLQLGFRGRFLTSFGYSGGQNDFTRTSVDLTDEQIRVMVMVCADGCFGSSSDTSSRCTLRLSKDRKLLRAKELLNDAGIEFIHTSIDDELVPVHTIKFNAPERFKSLSYFWKASPSQLRIICDEVFHWDGNFDDSVFFTRDKTSADFMSFAFAACGKRSVMREDIDKSDGKVDYRVFAHSNIKVGIAASPEKQEFTRVPSPDGFKYCFTTATGYWIMRRGGVIAVTGNCGMMAVQTTLKADHLPDNLASIRSAIEAAVPHGRTDNGGKNDRGSWGTTPTEVNIAWMGLEGGYKKIVEKTPGLKSRHGRVPQSQLGTLGGGNHFIEMCIDESNCVWIMFHSGSRGVGNLIGSYFIEGAKKEMGRWFVNESLPDINLSYLPEGSELFDDYIQAVGWAQNFARENRELMMAATLRALKKSRGIPKFETTEMAVNCFAGETRILTKDGSKEIRDLVDSSPELLTAGGIWVSAPVRSFGKQELYQIVLSRCGTRKVIFATANHGWIISPVQRARYVEKTTIELQRGDRLAAAFPERIFARLDKRAAARGFVFGDGHKSSPNRCAANFCGGKDSELLSLFDSLGNPVKQYEETLRITGLPGDWKEAIPLDASVDELYGWLAGYFAADGDVDRTGRPTLASAKKENLEFVRQLCTKLGIGTFGIRKRMRLGFGSEPTPLFMIGLMRRDLDNEFFLLSSHRERFITGKEASERRHWTVMSVSTTGRYEDVYCATVDKTHCFALEDNILTRNCHHNYVEKENHFGKNVWVTRKGAIRARKGDLGIIPGSMGAKSFIVRGLGCEDSFCSASHGAGRVMGREEAKRTFTLKDHRAATEGVECKKDSSVLDETPGAYKDIVSVMNAQKDLVEIVHTLKQVVCVKG